ncbi:unnamed protein product [Ilex paraguariensis]|uniref:Uncharacterized protein n=1 Tax=Ilex paraguariensis TaxID=185542 RepID=A0ABC8SW70_9AQUA
MVASFGSPFLGGSLHPSDATQGTSAASSGTSPELHQLISPSCSPDLLLFAGSHLPHAALSRLVPAEPSAVMLEYHISFDLPSTVSTSVNIHFPSPGMGSQIPNVPSSMPFPHISLLNRDLPTLPAQLPGLGSQFPLAASSTQHSQPAQIPPYTVTSEKGQQSKQNPEKGNNIATLNEVNELVDGLNGTGQNLSTQVNLGDCDQQQIGEGMGKSQQTGSASTSMESEALHRVGMQNDDMGVSKVLENIGSNPLVQSTLDTPNVVGVCLETLPSPSPDPFINNGPTNDGLCQTKDYSYESAQTRDWLRGSALAA